MCERGTVQKNWKSKPAQVVKWKEKEKRKLTKKEHYKEIRNIK